MTKVFFHKSRYYSKRKKSVDFSLAWCCTCNDEHGKYKRVEGQEGLDGSSVSGENERPALYYFSVGEGSFAPVFQGDPEAGENFQDQNKED